MNPPIDPVYSALADLGVRLRLHAAGRAFLGCRVDRLPRTQRDEEANAIVSETAVRALQRRNQFDPTRDVVNWLIGIVLNVAREYGRECNQTATGPPVDPPLLEDLVEDLSRPVAEVVANRALVDDLLHQLPFNDRELLRLRYEEGLTFAEIGERFGESENSQRVQHFRILKRLRELCNANGEVRS